MLLNRIARSIAQLDWLTVGIEVLVVVIGIYLGLQANEWSQDRDDRRAEIRYLERIAADLETSIAATQADIAFQRKHAKLGGLILDALSACELPPGDRDRFATGIYLAGKFINATFVSASIEELMSSGRTRIIRNAVLRQRLIERLTDYEEHRFYMSDVQLRTAPHVNYIDSVAPIIVAGEIGGGADVSWSALAADFEAMCTDQRFFAAVAAVTNYTWDSTAALNQWADALASLRNEIAVELAGLQGGL